ncbi:hypothetical protein Hanom_Chr13g01224201 [Helianthus anomalus]
MRGSSMRAARCFCQRNGIKVMLTPHHKGSMRVLLENKWKMFLLIKKLAATQNQRSLINSIDVSIQNSDHNDLNASNKDQDMHL